MELLLYESTNNNWHMFASELVTCLKNYKSDESSFAKHSQSLVTHQYKVLLDRDSIWTSFTCSTILIMYKFDCIFLDTLYDP